MVTTENFSEMIGKDVFTEKGIYCGKVSDLEIDLEKFKVGAVVIDAVKGSYLASIVGNKKGVVVPFPMVVSIGDIVLIKNISPNLPSMEEAEETEQKPVPLKF
ncbi:MAG: PRC-barrel domain-containing protein [Candidatus Aenigmarchaeota archaeon]|nr:PRC-barrel domain-containing protein [Candidatus Aenigmarchaeota archaeon]